jgi:hypothetical protein
MPAAPVTPRADRHVVAPGATDSPRGIRLDARGRWLRDHRLDSFLGVRDEREADAARSSVRRVFARVTLQSSWLRELGEPAVDQPGEGKRLIHLFGNPGDLRVLVSLSAEDRDGRRIDSGALDFGMGGSRCGVWHRWHGPPLPVDAAEANRLMQDHRVDVHDIEDGINQMLGRDPELHHPPRLSWQNLISALAKVSISVTERDLIEVPLTIELTPEVQAELDRI